MLSLNNLENWKYLGTYGMNPWLWLFLFNGIWKFKNFLWALVWDGVVTQNSGRSPCMKLYFRLILNFDLSLSASFVEMLAQWFWYFIKLSLLFLVFDSILLLHKVWFLILTWMFLNQGCFVPNLFEMCIFYENRHSPYDNMN